MEFHSYQSGPPNETRPSFGGLFYRLLSYPVLTFILSQRPRRYIARGGIIRTVFWITASWRLKVPFAELVYHVGLPGHLRGLGDGQSVRQVAAP